MSCATLIAGNGSKTIAIGSRASNCIHAVDYYMKKSNFLSEDLKKACFEHSEKFHELGMALLAVIFYAAQKQSIANIDDTESRLISGDALLPDFVAAYKEIVCYGEAVILNNTLASLSNEPTRAVKSDYGLWQNYHEPTFRTALDEIYHTINELGRQAQWSSEKIKLEQEIFTKKIITLFDQYIQEADYIEVLSSRIPGERFKTLQQACDQQEKELAAAKIKIAEYEVLFISKYLPYIKAATVGGQLSLQA